MEFSRQEYWSGLLCPHPGDLPGPGIEPGSLMFTALVGGFYTKSATWEAPVSLWKWKVSESESHSVMSDSLRPHELYSPWNSPGQNTGVGSLSLLQGIFPTQESNQGLLHCRWILYKLSHQGSPRILEWVAYPFSSRSSRPRNQTEVSCIAGRFLVLPWAIREAMGWYQREDMLGIWQNVMERPISESSQTPVEGRKSTTQYFWKHGIGVLGRGGSHQVNLEAYSRQWIWTSQWWCWVDGEVILLTVPWYSRTQYWRLLERKTWDHGVPSHCFLHHRSTSTLPCEWRIYDTIFICTSYFSPINMYAFKKSWLQNLWGFPDGSDNRESACNAGDTGYNPGSGRFSLRRNHSSIPGEFRGQRSPVGYSPWIRHDWATNTFTFTKVIHAYMVVVQWKLNWSGTPSCYKLHKNTAL